MSSYLQPVQQGTEQLKSPGGGPVRRQRIKSHCQNKPWTQIIRKEHHAQVAELVDALVSNTNEVTLVPVRLRPWVQKNPFRSNFEGVFVFFRKTLRVFFAC
jgi:hypothetical protein